MIRTRRTPEGLPVHSFRTLLQDLATLSRNRTRVRMATATFDRLTRPTPLQARALELPEASLR